MHHPAPRLARIAPLLALGLALAACDAPGSQRPATPGAGASSSGSGSSGVSSVSEAEDARRIYYQDT